MPSARQRARSPVRYMRAPGRDEKGSATKRSARQLGALEVAAHHAQPPMNSSPGTPSGSALLAAVEDVQAGVGDGRADRHGHLVGRQLCVVDQTVVSVGPYMLVMVAWQWRRRSLSRSPGSASPPRIRC